MTLRTDQALDASELTLQGEHSDLTQKFDWAEHPLGPVAEWPEPLRLLVRAVQDSQGAMLVCWGEQLHTIYNAHYARLIGDKHPAVFAQPIRQVWPGSACELEGLLARVLRRRGVTGESKPFVRSINGIVETAFCSFSCNPLSGPEGDVRGFFCSAFEATEIQRSQQAKQDEASRLLQLFEQAPGFVALLEGPEHVFKHANKAYLDFVGRSEIVGLRVTEVAPEAIAQGWGDVLDEVYRSGEPFFGRKAVVKLRRAPEGLPEELVVNFIFQPIRSRSGAITGVLIQGYDVTSEARSEAALRESEAKFRAIADTIPQMVWTTRADGYHEYFNNQWYAFTGLTEGSTDGNGWKDVLHPDDLERTTEVWNRSLSTGAAYQIEYRLRDHQGQYRWMLGRALPVRDDRGTIIRWMGTCTEIDEHVRSRETLREYDRRKDEFLAMLAHELRNPLAPISSAVALLRRTPDDLARVQSMTEIIQRQAEHMRGLVDDLLDVSRVTRGLIELQLECVDLSEVLTEALEQARPLIENRRHAVVTRIGSQELLVSGDRKRLVQVFSNILGNAAKYTSPGGRITVEARMRAGSVVVRVEDDGQGMQPELIGRVFELFSQGERNPDRHEGGLGIGLALVRRMVELHGGRVSAHSDGLDRGSTFEVMLPSLKSGSRAKRPETDRETSPASKVLRILIVDDNCDAADALAMFLQELGHVVHVENTASRGLESARKVAPDVCLLDIGLPDASGRELARQIRAVAGLSNVLIAAISGYGQPEDVAATEAAGMTHFVKPVDAEALAMWLAKHFLKPFFEVDPIPRTGNSLILKPMNS